MEPDSDALREEITGNHFRHTTGFLAKYFERKSWSAAIEELVDNLPANAASRLLEDFIGLQSQGPFETWMTEVQTRLHPDHRVSLYRSQGGESSDRPLKRILYLAESSTNPCLPPSIFDARVFGELDVSASDSGADDFLSFYAVARQVFQAKPTRLFLHGFQVRGNMMELWTFDRSGAYSSDKFDIAKQPKLIMKILASYAMMDDEDVGFNPFILRDPLGDYVTFSNAKGHPTDRLYLQEPPIAAPEYIVGPGTTCYATRAENSQTSAFVVKFAWREETQHTEKDLLELTKARGVWGVISASGWHDINTIRGLRQDLCFNKPDDLQLSPVSESGTSPAGFVSAAIRTASEQGRHRLFIDRTLSCIATSPLGQSINKFASIIEFLEACRDVARTLRSLYQDGKILHRDICVKNLIIPAHHSEGDAKGVLIDLDGALDLEKGPARRGELVGSEGFMAIGILSGDSHTYRHDLESLLYVFLWVAICNDHEHDDTESLHRQPKTSRLWGWCSIDFKSVAKNKLVDMSPDGFSRVLGEFSAEFEHLKYLADQLRQMLFPTRDGGIFIGSDMDEGSTNKLYDGVIGAFHQAISLQAQGNPELVQVRAY